MTEFSFRVVYPDGGWFLTDDPQLAVDHLVQRFPDVKPSPPKPKVGDRIHCPDPRRNADSGVAVAEVLDGRLLVVWDDRQYGSVHPSDPDVTVIERGES